MAHADLRGDELFVTTDWVEKDMPGQVPGMNFRSARPNREEGWYGPLSWGCWVTLERIFEGRLTVSQELADWFHGRSANVMRCLSYRDAIETTEGDWDDGTEFDNLRPYQQIGTAFIGLTPDGVLIADDMGTGKTPTTLQAINRLPDSLPALVVCPNSVKYNWEVEAATWLGRATPYVIDGGMQARRKILAEAALDPTALVIINFEGVRTHSRMAPYGSVRLIRCTECGGPDPDVTARKCQKHPGELNEITWSTVVIDEAHKQKDPKSQQTRACWAIQDQPSVKYRIALTGTPIANDVGDLWAILRGLARRDFPTKTEFIDRFALLAWNQHAVLDIVGVRPDRRDEFNLVVQPRLRRVLKDIVLPELPSKVRITRTAPMTGKQQRAYRQMEEEMMSEVDDGVIVSSSNLVKATRLLQFSSAFARLDHEHLTPRGLPTVVLSEPSPKLDVMEEILEELGDRQVAICAMSRQLIDLAAARLLKRTRPVSFRLLTGAVPTPERATNVAAFQRGDVRAMLFTVQAGGVGINLTAADTIIFLQRSWSMLENRQAEDRVHRIGSERHESIQIIDIVAPGTIEVGQLRRLADKQRMLEEVVQDRAARTRAGISTEDLNALENSLLGEHLL